MEDDEWFGKWPRWSCKNAENSRDTRDVYIVLSPQISVRWLEFFAFIFQILRHSELEKARENIDELSPGHLRVESKMLAQEEQ